MANYGYVLEIDGKATMVFNPYAELMDGVDPTRDYISYLMVNPHFAWDSVNMKLLVLLYKLNVRPPI